MNAKYILKNLNEYSTFSTIGAIDKIRKSAKAGGFSIESENDGTFAVFVLELDFDIFEIAADVMTTGEVLTEFWNELYKYKVTITNSKSKNERSYVGYDEIIGYMFFGEFDVISLTLRRGSKKIRYEARVNIKRFPSDISQSSVLGFCELIMKLKKIHEKIIDKISAYARKHRQG